MQAITGNKNINRNLAQFKHALEGYLIDNESDVKWIIEKINNINHKVEATDYLREYQADWIGCTLLHFAAWEDLEVFNILLDHGADFTIQNNNNLTPLHQLIDDCKSHIIQYYELDNPFVNSILLAHLKYENFENPSNSNGLSHFHIACAANNFEVVKKFINSGVCIDDVVEADSPYFPGFSPLHFAANFCALDVASLLLFHGANVHIKDAKGMTPLHLALERKIRIMENISSNSRVIVKNELILKWLLDKEKNDADGLTVIDGSGLSDFHVMCTLTDSRLVEPFLQNNININSIVNMDSPLWPGYTALHFAALCNINTVKLLVKRGADMSIKNAKGMTSFDMCIERYKAKEIHAILSAKPMSMSITHSDGKAKYLSDLISAPTSQDSFNRFLKTIPEKVMISLSNDLSLWPGSTPMHLAVIFSTTNVKEFTEVNPGILKTLHKQSPSMLHSQDIHGYTPLHLAFRLNKKPVLELLMGILQECTDLIDRVDEDGLSYVHIASAQNNVHLLTRLLSMGINVNTVYQGKSPVSKYTCLGSTALHFAVVNGSHRAIRTLMSFGADLHAKNTYDMTPVHMVLVMDRKPMGRILLESPSIEDSVVNGIGLSHLHVACYCDDVRVAAHLLDNGADVNGMITCEPDANGQPKELSFLKMYAGYTPLLVARQEHNINVASLLLKRGADILVKNANGDTLLFDILRIKNTFLDPFIETLREDDALKARLNVDIGMTPLHVACLFADVESVKKLINERANVDAQIRVDSPVLPGFTPLHTLVYKAEEYFDGKRNVIMTLLLKAGASVTLQSANSDTVIHTVYDFLHESGAHENFSLVDTLLGAQRDFSVNPASVDGISHFHIACSTGNHGVVKKFLKHGNVDVNRPIDYFLPVEEAGYSALHFAATAWHEVGLAKKLKTIDLLMDHGANVHAEDAWGDTPLHKCAHYGSPDVFERLARSSNCSGADLNVRNVCGDTPLKGYLGSRHVSVEGIKTMLRFGCRLNTYCITTGEGYMGEILKVLSFSEAQNLFLALSVNFKQEMKTDDMRRTVIHNMVSAGRPRISANEYIALIEQISGRSWNVDAQDNLGRTALHNAIRFQNFAAVSGLLTLGADVNIHASDRETAFAYDFDANANSENLQTLEILATHIKKLQLLGLDVNKKNEDFAFEAFEKLLYETTRFEGFFKELEIAKSTKIKSHSLTARDFLSETGAVADYPTMSQIKRHDVKKFFSSNAQKIRTHFPELAGVLQLQYRKARARSKLVQSAKEALTELMGFTLPDIVSHFIFILLKNSDLKNLIESATLKKKVSYNTVEYI